MAMRQSRTNKPRPPLDRQGLEERALAYAGRFATSRAKLAAYLRRKLRERGWSGADEPPVDDIVGRMAELGYVDDRAFAAARAASFGRRGYGVRRLGQALRAAGIEDDDAAEARDLAEAGAWQAALRYAERRRIGPFAAGEADRAGREKALAAMLRAGHPMGLAQLLVRARPGEIPDPDSV
jgi:regulatory protein